MGIGWGEMGRDVEVSVGGVGGGGGGEWSGASRRRRMGSVRVGRGDVWDEDTAERGRGRPVMW